MMPMAHPIWAASLMLLLLTTATYTAPVAAAAPGNQAATTSSNHQAAAAGPFSTAALSDIIAVPHPTLGSILSSILKWPSSLFGDSSSPTPAVQAGDNSVFTAPASSSAAVAPAASGSVSSSTKTSTNTHSTPSSSGAAAAAAAQIVEPLTDAGIAAINRLLASNDSGKGPYRFDTGLPPLKELVNINSTAQQQNPSTSLSADRIQQLAQLSEPLGWVIKTFAISGDALLKLKLSTNLQLIIRDIISSSIAQTADIPEQQVLTFAVSNVSISLEIKGVQWPSTDAAATSDINPALAAIKEALAELAGGFDPQHINVSFHDPILTAAAAAAGAGGSARRLLQLPTAAAVAATPSQQQQQPVVVYATFYNVDPANSTALLEALGKQCSASLQSASSDPGGNTTLFSPLKALVPRAEVTPGCEAEFAAEFIKQGVPVALKDFAITPVDKPQSTVDLSVAVGLTNAQTLDNSHEKTSDWLNSSAVNDILAGFNLTAVPTDFTEYVYDPVTGTFPQIPGLNLSSLMSELFPTPSPEPGAAVQTGYTAGTVFVGKAMIAGITVAAVTSLLALAGVVWLLVSKRSAAATQHQDLPSSAAVGDDANNRRRRRRPRVYHNKYLNPDAARRSDTAADGADTSSPTAEPPKTHLERGDSVSSAVKFEVDDQPLDHDDSGQQQQYASSNRSSDSCAASSSSSNAVQSSTLLQQQQQQRVVELQLYRAAGHVHGSGAASAYSLLHDQAGSSMLSDLPSSRDFGSNVSLPSQLMAAAGVEDDNSGGLIGSRLQNQQLKHQVKQQMQGQGIESGVGFRASHEASELGLIPQGLGLPGMPSLQVATSRASSMQRTVSATLLSDAANAVLAQKALARSQSTAANSTGLIHSSSSMLQQQPSGPARGLRISGPGFRGSGSGLREGEPSQDSQPGGPDSPDRSGMGIRGDPAAEEEISSPLPPRNPVVSATCTPPATPVADAAALFAAMDAQLAADAAVCGGVSNGGVQPLGASCWHKEGHVSGFLMPEAAAGWPVGLPHEQLRQQQRSRQQRQQQMAQQQQRHTTGGWVPPFSSEQQQHQLSYRHSSGACSLSRVEPEQQQQQQQQVRHSSGGGTMSSPFASESEQRRISSSNGELASIIIHDQQQQQGQRVGTNGGYVSPFALAAFEGPSSSADE